MKNLSKIKLEDVVVLSDLQMKLVKGGATNEDLTAKCEQDVICKKNSDCGTNPSCVCKDMPNWNKKSCTIK